MQIFGTKLGGQLGAISRSSAKYLGHRTLCLLDKADRMDAQGKDQEGCQDSNKVKPEDANQLVDILVSFKSSAEMEQKL